jgi:hypothetical protein
MERKQKMTKKLFSFFAALAVVLSLTALGMADDKVTLTGNIVDKACSAKVAKKDDPQAAAALEAKDCVVRCSKGGLGIYADGKYTEFDEAGAAKAKTALEKSTKDKGAKFKVTGTIMDGKLMVESVSEVE